MSGLGLFNVVAFVLERKSYLSQLLCNWGFWLLSQ